MNIAANEDGYKSNSIWVAIFIAILTASLLWLPEFLYKTFLYDFINDSSDWMYSYFSRFWVMTILFILGVFGFLFLVKSFYVSGPFGFLMGLMGFSIIITWNYSINGNQGMVGGHGIANGFIFSLMPVYGLFLYLLMVNQWATPLGRALRASLFNAFIAVITTYIVLKLIHVGSGDPTLPLWVYLFLFTGASYLRWVTERSFSFYRFVINFIKDESLLINSKSYNDLRTGVYHENLVKNYRWKTAQESISSGFFVCMIAYFIAVFSSSAGKELWLVDPLTGKYLGLQSIPYILDGFSNNINPSTGIGLLLGPMEYCILVIKVSFYWTGLFDCILNQMPYFMEDIQTESTV